MTRKLVPYEIEERKKHRALRQQFARTPVTTIQALVGPETCGAVDVRGVWKCMVFVMDVVAWKAPSGAVIEQPMRVMKAVPDSTVSRYMRTIKPLSQWNLRVRVVQESALGKCCAWLVELGTKSQSTQLRAVAKALRRPVSFIAPNLGRFVLNRGFQQFEWRTRWRGRSATVVLETVDIEEARVLCDQLRILWRSRVAWGKAIDKRIKTEVYDEWVNIWRLDDPVMSTREFARRVTLETISISSDHVSLSFDDDDLFGGHAIVFEGTVRGGPKSFSIEG